MGCDLECQLKIILNGGGAASGILRQTPGELELVKGLPDDDALILLDKASQAESAAVRAVNRLKKEINQLDLHIEDELLISAAIAANNARLMTDLTRILRDLLGLEAAKAVAKLATKQEKAAHEICDGIGKLLETADGEE